MDLIYVAGSFVFLFLSLLTISAELTYLTIFSLGAFLLFHLRDGDFTQQATNNLREAEAMYTNKLHEQVHRSDALDALREYVQRVSKSRE